jgi:peptidoglycan/LPS O-acetylase OafA/YrhL
MKTPPTSSAPSPTRTGPDTVENIQALRGIAALLVLWAHIKFPIGALCPEGYDRSPWVQTGQGAIGVDLFFVISGFVISLVACKRHHRPVDFLLARVARISPLYLVFVLLFLLVKGVFMHRYNSFSSVWNGIFYLPIFDMKDLSWPPGGSGWTLCFEMWFYLCFALLLCFQAPKNVATMLPFIFIVGSLCSLCYTGDWYFPTFMFHPLTLDFAFGCIIYQLQHLISGKIAGVLLLIGALWAFFITRHTGYLAYPQTAAAVYVAAWQRTLFWGVPCAFLAAGLVGLERNRLFTMPAALVWVGGISYSLYLSYQVSMDTITAIGRHLGVHSLWLVLVVVVAGCVFNAWLCWRFIENPLSKVAQKWAKSVSERRENASAVRPA